MVTAEEGSSWIYKNKDRGTWFNSMIVNPFERDDECGDVSRIEFDTEIDIDKYTYSAKEHVKVGGSFQMQSIVEFWFYPWLGWCLVCHRDA